MKIPSIPTPPAQSSPTLLFKVTRLSVPLFMLPLSIPHTERDTSQERVAEELRENF